MGHSILKIAAAAALTVATSAFASTVYDMVGNGGNFSYTSGSEYGDQIQLAGTDRVITEFTFKYFANYDLPAGLTFRIYAQDGPLIQGQASPGTLIDTYVTDVLGNGATVHISYPLNFGSPNVIPSSLTYTVQFAGLTAGHAAGLIAPGGTPVIGSSFNDFWEKTGTGDNDWALKTFIGGVPTANFIATITAVPEPGTVALMIVGAGLVLVGARRSSK